MPMCHGTRHSTRSPTLITITATYSPKTRRSCRSSGTISAVTSGSRASGRGDRGNRGARRRREDDHRSADADRAVLAPAHDLGQPLALRIGESACSDWFCHPTLTLDPDLTSAPRVGSTRLHPRDAARHVADPVNVRGQRTSQAALRRARHRRARHAAASRPPPRTHAAGRVLPGEQGRAPATSRSWRPAHERSGAGYRTLGRADAAAQRRSRSPRGCR